MNREHMLSRISIDPNICHGQAYNKGTRIMVGVILNCLAAGMSEQESWPSIQPLPWRTSGRLQPMALSWPGKKCCL